MNVPQRRYAMPDHVYKVIDLVGSSNSSVEDAIQGAIGRAAETITNLDWFEVKEIRGSIQGGKVGWYQVKLGVGFQVLHPGDLAKGS
jgi:flavin-binding protein dodecin